MATKWTPLGFSCPVNCANVISAINRLKMIDYDTIIMPDASYENAVDSIEQYIDRLTRAKVLTSVSKVNPTKGRLLINDAVEKIETARKMRRRSFKGNCLKYYKTADKVGLKKCLSLSNGHDVDEIIGIISAALTKYSSTNVSVQITKKLLVKMIGEEDLVAGKFNVKAVVKFLTHAFHAYEDIKKNKLVIQLRSQHCLTTHVPGCFCSKGYVERFGRCIKPSDCYSGSMYDKYMARIIIV
ncbi:uncharacterized protein LOC128682320 isoform X2 [Plodia interpunctella]|nr:uncharacterized protein LOC128682320 isoform X2 [Plodia interpunctella]XP_053622946.1 uncharacterized protein LOC128682320 isoform X2 [Plodia interpunctella]